MTAKAKAPSEKAPTKTLPTLRTALWIYLAALLGTVVIIGGLSRNILPLFLQFLAAMIVVAGFTIAAVFLQRASFTELFGQRPKLLDLLLSFISGVAAWVIFYWLTGAVIYSYLAANVAPLPSPSMVDFEINATTYLLQYGLIIPFCHSLLFWGYLQRPAERQFGMRGAVLVGVLYGLFGVFWTDFASSAIPALILVGLVAALMTYFGKSLWYGFAVTSAYFVSGPFLANQINNYYFQVLFDKSQFQNALSLRWLLLVLVAGFVVFILLQIFRVRNTAETPTPRPKIPLQRMWWMPLAFSVVLIALAVSAEFSLRASYKRPAGLLPVTSSTNPAVPPVPVPGAGATSKAP